jgi:putative tryptophan/tyrosine transport system substrate-binding protein
LQTLTAVKVLAKKMQPGSHSGRVLVCLVGLFVFAQLPAIAADVVAVKSRELGVYDKAIDGFKKDYSGSLSVLLMQGDLSDPGKLASAVRSQGPKVILAVGLGAAKALKAEISDIPIVFVMAMNPIQAKLRSNNATGVYLEPTAHDQLKAFREALPDVKRIGVIYDDRRTGPFIREAAKSAAAAGVTLIAIKISQKKDVPAALNEVIKRADALWLIRDATVMSREFFKRTLILQFERKIPLLAYSPMFVKKLAVCSFASSYSDQGKKAAEIVKRVLAGANVGDIPIQAPAGTLTVNVNSAAKAGVKLSQEVLTRSDVVRVGK